MDYSQELDDLETDTSVLFEGDKSDDDINVDEIQSTNNASKRRKLFLGSFLVLCALVLVIVLPVVLTQDNRNGDNSDRSFGQATTVDAETLGLDGIDEPGSYQNAAYTWLVNDVEFKTLDDWQVVQRYAVASLYLATSSLPTPGAWTSASGWLTAATECDWEGVTCTRGTVVGLDLAAKGLTGPLPKELELLTDLFLLDLGGNGLTGPIPPELGSLQKLAFLDLEGCDLSGPIPKELGGLGKLQQLLLNGNPGIVGPVPEEFGSLASMYMLQLQGTDLIGSMPRSVCELFEQDTLGAARLLSADCAKLRCRCCTECADP